MQPITVAIGLTVTFLALAALVLLPDLAYLAPPSGRPDGALLAAAHRVRLARTADVHGGPVHRRTGGGPGRPRAQS